MKAPTLYLAWPHGDEATLARVIVWPDYPHQINPRCAPIVALEVEGQPGVWDRPHQITEAQLAASYVSEDPELARSAVHRAQVDDYVTAEDHALPWEDDDQEGAA